MPAAAELLAACFAAPVAVLVELEAFDPFAGATGALSAFPNPIRTV